MTIKISFQIVPQQGDYPLMRERWMQAEELGVDGLYSADHFHAQTPSAETYDRNKFAPAADGKILEGMMMQAAMAATTTKPEIGCIVHAIGFRNPNLLADMARTIDHISGGRFMLGLGAGYLQEDYEDYGYEWGTAKSRMEDLQRALPIIKARFEKLNPRPLHKIPIMIAAGGENLGLKLVAQYADAWHFYGSLDLIAQKIEVLKTRCKEVGRDFSEIELSTWYVPAKTSLRLDPDELVKLGITHIIQAELGPTWDMGRLRELLEWRKNRERSGTTATGRAN